MDFTLSDEQQQFRQTLRSFVDRDIAPVARDWEQTDRYPTEIVDAMREMGLFGLLVPEEFGGLAVDAVSFALVFEEISRGWMGISGILGSHSMACWLVARYGDAAQREEWLPCLAAGEVRSGLALTEPSAGSDLQGITTRAEVRGDDYVLQGTKMWITNARHAGMLPVLVKTDRQATPAHRGMSVLLVPMDADGVTVTRDIPKLGYKGTESCEIVFDDVHVPRSCLLGEEEGRGLQQVLAALETGRINVAARGVGLAQAAYEAALRYAGQREAFGRPIGEFQAIQIALADMATKVQAARLMTWWAAAALDSGGRADVESSMAKLVASEAAVEVSLAAMRVHGGYGYSKEFDVERYYRDAPLLVIGEGTNDILRTVIAKGLLRDGAPWD
ncbi:MAG: acyl-CoA dehydrogenase family protein [Nitriliruptoraceae bacterium]